MHSQLLTRLKSESKYKTSEGGGVRARSLTHNTLRGRGACQSSGMGLGRVDKLIHSHGPAHNPHKVISAQLEHQRCQDESRATRTHKTHHSPDLGEATTFPLIVYFAPLHGAYIQMAFLSWDSRVGVPKLRQPGLPRLWSPITLRADLGSRCGLKQSCSSCRELSNGMSQVIKSFSTVCRMSSAAK